MFFNRLLKIMFLCLFVYVLGINLITFMFVSVEGRPYEFKGFYDFFEHVSTFPGLHYFIDSLTECVNDIGNVTTGEIIAHVVTLGVSFIVKLLWYVSKAATVVIWDIIRIMLWVLEFLGIIPDISIV